MYSLVFIGIQIKSSAKPGYPPLLLYENINAKFYYLFGTCVVCMLVVSDNTFSDQSEESVRNLPFYLLLLRADFKCAEANRHKTSDLLNFKGGENSSLLFLQT